MTCATHTHCAPALASGLDFIFGSPVPADQKARIERYTRELIDAMEKAALRALAARAPGRLAWGQGSVDVRGQSPGAQEGQVGEFRGQPERPGGPQLAGTARDRSGGQGPGRAGQLRLPLHDPRRRVQQDLRRVGRVRLRRDRAAVPRRDRPGDHRLRRGCQPRTPAKPRRRQEPRGGRGARGQPPALHGPHPPARPADHEVPPDRAAPRPAARAARTWRNEPSSRAPRDSSPAR